MEVKQIVSGSSPLLSYSSNPLLSKDDSKLLIFPIIGRPFAVTTFRVLVVTIAVALIRVIQRRRPTAILSWKLPLGGVRLPRRSAPRKD